MKSGFLYCILLSLLSLVRGRDDWNHLSCDLQCSNGGYCTFIDGTPEELARQSQSGKMVEKCVCRPGFTGMTCDTKVEQCSSPDRTCHNGAPCTQNIFGEWTCDCSQADKLSLFAGHQCRIPSTEYCSGPYNPNTALSFCTNGGRCKADFLAAKVAPGDTTFNSAYKHLGCRCPPEFFGPHCEFLKFQNVQEQKIPEIGAARSGKRRTAPFTLVMLALMSLSAVMVAAMIFKLKRQMVPSTITIDRPSTSYGYDESRYNGRHISHENQNLHIQAVFEDTDIA